MKNIRPCPYCGGEIEMVRLADINGQKTFRIQCLSCKALVAKGQGFEEKELKKQSLERIKQYEEFMEHQFARPVRFTQSDDAVKRDIAAVYGSRADYKNDEYDYLK